MPYFYYFEFGLNIQGRLANFDFFDGEPSNAEHPSLSDIVLLLHDHCFHENRNYSIKS